METPGSNSLNDLFTNMSMSENDDMSKTVKELSSIEKRNILSELNDREISILTRMLSIATLTGIKEFQHIVYDYMLMKISRNRQSRKEMVEVLKAQLISEIEKEKKMNQIRTGLGIT